MREMWRLTDVNLVILEPTAFSIEGVSFKSLTGANGSIKDVRFALSNMEQTVYIPKAGPRFSTPAVAAGAFVFLVVASTLLWVTIRQFISLCLSPQSHSRSSSTDQLWVHNIWKSGEKCSNTQDLRSNTHL